MADMITFKINGVQIEVDTPITIFEAAKKVNVKIPTLCRHEDLSPSSACGVCCVKVEGQKKMFRACSTYVTQDMVITTHDPEITAVRKTVLELILSNHPNSCLDCGRNRNCELQALAAEFGIRELTFEEIPKNYEIDESIKTIVLEPNKCIKCERCIQACQDMQDVWALSLINRGIETKISPAAGFSLKDSPCISCGQCSAYCPVGAIYEYDETQKVSDALFDPEKYCVAQIAPSIRVAIGESFGMKSGEITTGKIYTLLRQMGFDAVFDTNFGADVTIMEEGTEFVKRLTTEGSILPMITTCCPAWVDFMEKFHSDMIPHFSTCKSPHEMLATLSKTYYAQKMGLNPENIYMVSIMPCIAKKLEIQRSKEMYVSGVQNVDVSITTREFARMIKQTGINFSELDDSEPDCILAGYSGGGTIFGTTGGVMEAALRNAGYLLTGHNLENIEFEEIRGLKGIKKTELKIGEYTLKIAVAHNLSNVEHILDKIRAAKEQGLELPYHFIEVMACPGGCIGGGGQPRNVNDKVRTMRAQGLYLDDKNQKYRNCHDNPCIKQLYDEFLKEPGSEKSHELLHLSYTPRPKYGQKIE